MGGRLLLVLQEQRVSQAELARRVGIKQQSIQKLCSNESARTGYVAEIAEALNICPFWLATGEGLKTPLAGPGRRR